MDKYSFSRNDVASCAMFIRDSSRANSGRGWFFIRPIY
eukprot:XP_001704059.1 Hypothetical protein GL50803_31471 [Giardia lamblia ATCC 50803]